MNQLSMRGREGNHVILCPRPSIRYERLLVAGCWLLIARSKQLPESATSNQHPYSVRSGRVELTANLAAWQIARRVGDRRDSVVRVHVDVGAAAPHPRDELRERVPLSGPTRSAAVKCP